MKAALVTTYGTDPHYGDVPEPDPAEGEVVLDVLAVGLHPRVRSQAAGSHYTSTEELPLVPGVDGVGRDPEGVLRYFVLGDGPAGSMAERVAVDPRRTAVLPEASDPVALAAAMNPAMSSWVALRRRIGFEVGQSVLVHGATGNAGRMAVQVVKLLGAGHVVAAGRDAERLAALPALGADLTVSLEGDDVAARLGEAAGDVDVAIDYVWGQPAAAAMAAIVTARADRSRPLTWIEVGSMGGLEAPIPSAALRAARLQIVGSGQGSVSTREIAGELPALAEQIARGGVAVEARAVPLAEVERTWGEPGAPTERVVFVP